MDLKLTWTEKAAGLLVGRKIVRVSYLTAEECAEMGWTRSCIAIELDDGTAIYPSADDEGNNAGAIFTNRDALPIIPVIRA